MAEQANSQLPPLPAKKYLTISEASELCAVKPSVLRFWETRFKRLTKVERRRGRRYYTHSDIEYLRDIRSLLYDQDFSITEAQAILASGSRQQTVTQKLSAQRNERNDASDARANSSSVIKEVIDELENVIEVIRDER